MADHGRKDQIHKSQFHIDLEAMTCTYSAGHTTASRVPTGFWLDKTGQMRTKIGQIISFSIWQEALQGAFRALDSESVHLVQFFQQRLTAAGSKMPVFG